jgi:hypothetical protein
LSVEDNVPCHLGEDDLGSDGAGTRIFWIIHLLEPPHLQVVEFPRPCMGVIIVQPDRGLATGFRTANNCRSNP